MKKYIILIVVFVLCSLIFSGCAKKSENKNDLDVIKERGYIIAGVKNDSYPFGYRDKNNKRAGLDIEIAYEISNAIFNTSGYDKVKFVDVVPRDRITKLNSGEVDILVATMSVNPKRKLVVDFSKPYFVTSQKLLVRGDSKITHLNYFNKQGRITVVMGTTGEKLIRNLAPNANVTAVKNYKTAFDYLKTGAVDAILGDDCLLKGLINGTDKYKIINRAYSVEYYAVALRKNTKSKELMELVNSAISDIIDKKKLNVIKSHYKM